MADNEAATAACDAGPTTMLKFLIFRLGCVRFALRILGVDDILALNRYDDAQHSSEPVTTSLGHKIPVVDLRPRAPALDDAGKADEQEHYFIVVVETECAHKLLPVGLVVDRCAEILDFDARDVDIPAGNKPAASDARLGSRTARILRLEEVLPNVLRLDDHIMSRAAGCAN